MITLADLPRRDLLKQMEKAGGLRAFARKHGIAKSTLHDHLQRTTPAIFSERAEPQALEAGRGRRRFILTSAQDATTVHEAFLSNLEAYRDYLQADAPCELMIAGFTYNKSLFEDHRKQAAVYHERVTPYLLNRRLCIADRVDFCAEMNTLPTAEKPLSGFHTYTRDRWGIFPHAKVQLVSVPTMKNAPTKMVMTTGAVTRPNYVAKKAGLKASFHHVFGAVLVEVDTDGSFFCRHLIAEEDDGSFYDLDVFVCDSEVSPDHRVEVITPGDVHVAQIDPDAAKALFGYWPDDQRNWCESSASVLNTLRPKALVIHDVSDFRARNHHEIGNAHSRFRHHINGRESVEDELMEVAQFLRNIERDFCEIVVADSNHDGALLQWLQTADYKVDPVNARFFLQCQLRAYQAMEQRVSNFSIFEHVMRDVFEGIEISNTTRFLRADEPCEIGGVEQSNHGHRGPNGARGSLANLSKIGPKATIAHSHSPGIDGGTLQVGTTSKMDLGYNNGPSSWAHTFAIQYMNGKRTLVTIQNGKWRI